MNFLCNDRQLGTLVINQLDIVIKFVSLPLSLAVFFANSIILEIFFWKKYIMPNLISYVALKKSLESFWVQNPKYKRRYKMHSNLSKKLIKMF